jgi:hypothetical protein
MKTKTKAEMVSENGKINKSGKFPSKTRREREKKHK